MAEVAAGAYSMGLSWRQRGPGFQLRAIGNNRRQGPAGPNNFQRGFVFHKHFGTSVDVYLHGVAAVGAKFGIVFFVDEDFFITVVENYSEKMISRCNRAAESQSVAAVRRFQNCLKNEVIVRIDC